MHPPFTFNPFGEPPASHNPHIATETMQGIEALRQAIHRAQRVFLLVNTLPFTVTTFLFPYTEIASVRVAGQLTLCMLWGVLQCCLFVASTLWYEKQATRVCDPLEQALNSDMPRAAKLRPTNGVNREW
ncbi:DUF485 domain-containing protein [Streptomyces sp. NPDC029554]|uniref:DUF485 domain-containing protein n=1 Tax=Streptomyces sp. NPDC029554 TaxID=3155126 RepID=UPI00340D9F10